MSKTAIIASDYFNALYENGTLSKSGKPEYLNGNTLALLHPDADYYSMPEDVYDELLDGVDYPEKLSDVPLNRLHKID